jgi:hypothetical protein
VQGVHSPAKSVDRGELTSRKLRRDTVEPSPTKVQGVHKKKSVLSL